MIIVTLFVMTIYSGVLTAVAVMTLLIFVLIRYSSYAMLKKQTEFFLNAEAKTSSVFLTNSQSCKVNILISCFCVFYSSKH